MHDAHQFDQFPTRSGGVERDRGDRGLAVAKDTQLDPLRNDPRFIAFLDQVRRDWDERQRTLQAEAR